MINKSYTWRNEEEEKSNNIYVEWCDGASASYNILPMVAFLVASVIRKYPSKFVLVEAKVINTSSNFYARIIKVGYLVRPVVLNMCAPLIYRKTLVLVYLFLTANETK